VSSSEGSNSDTAAWKVDTAAPSNSPSQSGTSGNNGWYISTVSVSVSGTDATSGVSRQEIRVDGGRWVAGSAAISANGSHAVDFRVVDNAGHSTVNSTTIKVDQVAPSLSPSFSGSLGDNGWYTSAVTITVGGSDAHSGIASQQVEVSGLGWQNSGTSLNQDGSFTLNYAVEDYAGHTNSGTGAIKIDTTDPTRAVNVTGGGGAHGWHTSPVTIDVTGTDATSGLAAAELRVNGGAWQSGPVTLNTDGTFMVETRTVDKAGNVNSGASTYKLDLTDPGISYWVNGTMGENGWYVSDVDASVSGSDAGSGVDAEQLQLNGGSWTDSPQTITADGTYSAAFRVVDAAENSAAASDSFKIDQTPPTIPMHESGTGGTNGWYTSNVDISCDAADATSGIASQAISGLGSASHTYTSEGIVVVTCEAADNAGHTNEKTASLKIDKTDPTMVPSYSGTNGSNGWFMSAVAIELNGADAVSGVNSEQIRIDGGGWNNAPLTISADGIYAVDLRVTDHAGRTTTSSDTLKIDSTPPNSSPSIAGANGGGYYGPLVDIQPNGADTGSGVELSYVRIDGGAWEAPGSFDLDDGDHTIETLVIDNAGNRTTTSQVISVDAAPPTAVFDLPATCSGALTFSGHVSDLSGIDSGEIMIGGKTAPLSIDPSGDWSHTTKVADGTHPVVVKIMDLAGNTWSESGSFGSDSTAPVIDLDSTWESWAYGNLSIQDAGAVHVEIQASGPGYADSRGYRSNYPTVLYWRTLFSKNVWAKPGESVRVKVIATDSCGNVSKKTAIIKVVETVLPTPTLVPTIEPTNPQKPTEPPTQKPPEPTRLGKIQPTAVIEVAVGGAEPAARILFRFPFWLWALLASVSLLGVGAVFWDPRPRQINRHSRIKENGLAYFAETYEED